MLYNLPMKLRRSGAVLALLLPIACSSTKVQEGFYAGSKSRPKYSIQVDKQGKKEGRERWWHPDGRLKYEAINRGGVRDGRFTAWYPDGAKWYEGYERHGKPESTLTYWHPNGRVKSRALFRDGIQLEREDWDEAGRLLTPRNPRTAPSPEPAAESAEEASRLRQAGLRIWAMRVRQTVESYWRLPGELSGKPLRSIARIKVGSDGRILEVTWLEKSRSSSFNTLAQQTFRKIKRFPPFPPEVKEEALEIQYEFVSQGRSEPRRRLEARGGDAPGEAGEDGGGSAAEE